MTKKQFTTQIAIIERILKDLDMLDTRKWYPPYGASQAATFRKINYFETWKICIEEEYYDFQLNDNSLLLFKAESFRPLKMNYSYYECPYQCYGYYDFVEEMIGLNKHEVGEKFRSEYEEYLTTCSPKETVAPIRYDFAPEDYNEGIHPASHIHLGYANNIRIGTRKVLRPLSFLLFILRQSYPIKWQELLKMENAEHWSKNVRVELDDVAPNFLNRLDEWEMILT